MKLAIIVEGHGEVEAIPVLVRRITSCLHPVPHVEVLRPHRAKRGQLTKQEELRRLVELWARKTEPGDSILLVCDSDRDCPAELGPKLRQWGQQTRPDRTFGAVLCNREFEAWLMAAAQSLRGKRGLPEDLASPQGDPDDHRNPKAWFDQHLPNGYSETLDQAALAAVMDLDQALSSRSFRTFHKELTRLLAAR